MKSVEGDMRKKLLQIDYLGSLLTIISSVLLLLGLNWGGTTFSWSSVPVLVTLILGVVTLVAFLFWEAKYATLPIIPGELLTPVVSIVVKLIHRARTVHIFRNKTVSGVLVVTTMK